ncbi:uncharacterized protein TRUGW13939_11722 [Talaromyces rugulosus]|uniref:Aminoglycoside phosphotransferase domain-containing protein n=1 Tax=Talaromyces rugulosus TaxID=121627 RepID=A0A7H8REK6_TALRU|nr:uncharacterized protein TRUGW13939_11722 [Talaromyces rugulosus]QKX64547.1 hypothetical protein TRUGW13939_11722 [Talaromyces rugulosus]
MDVLPDLRGSKWTRTRWGREPRWAKVKFLAKGAFNRLYIVASDDKEVVVRVTLPIYPKWKTLGEVAIPQWVAQNSSLPVPQVLAYNIDRSNSVGFEWIMMDKVPGKPSADIWHELSFSDKEKIVRQLADLCSDTFQRQLTGIGSLFPDSDVIDFPLNNQDSHTFKVQGLVYTSFITRDPRSNISRGPFSTSKEWLSVRLDIAEIDCRQRLAQISHQDCQSDNFENLAADKAYNGDDEDEEEDPEDLENALIIIAKLQDQLDNFFPSAQLEPEPTMIFHDDLNQHNILIDENRFPQCCR